MPIPNDRGCSFLGGEKGEVHVLQVLGKHALDEGGLLTDGLQLAQGLFIVEQTNIVGREVAIAQDFLQFAALQGGGADNGNPKHTAPVSTVAA